MIKKSSLILTLSLIVILALAACSRSANPTMMCPFKPTSGAQPVQEDTATVAEVQPSPTLPPTPIPPTPSPALPTPEPGAVAFDFITTVCQASWSNSSVYLPCPGDLNYKEAGYIGVLESTALDNGIQLSASSLLTIPAQDGSATGITGRYPPFTVQKGDRFKTALGCMSSPEGTCDLVYALEYYDSNGGYHELAGAENLDGIAVSEPGGSLLLVDFPLDELAGQTVEFVLVIRDNDNPIGDNALWISPYIWRDPAVIAALQTATPPGEAGYTDFTPGVISGKVDFTNAPEYLYDEYDWVAPAAVVFFNQDNGTYWYNFTAHYYPEYQMTLPPGRYQVMAYAYNEDYTDYVSAAYTGKNPSCDEPLKDVIMPPNGIVDGIVITDWNWKCSGTAERPEKPAEIPIPY